MTAPENLFRIVHTVALTGERQEIQKLFRLGRHEVDSGKEPGIPVERGAGPEFKTSLAQDETIEL